MAMYRHLLRFFTSRFFLPFLNFEMHIGFRLVYLLAVVEILFEGESAVLIG